MHDFERALSESWPTDNWRDRTVLVAVSGGADSVALLRGLHRLHGDGVGRLVVGHFNHGLRGADSDADAGFVAELAGQLQLPLAQDRRMADGSGSEERLRDDRYEFLQRTAEAWGARYVVTAHTANDQVETILHRILRGTGVAGLAGIRRARPLGDAAMLLRPMLGISRAVVLGYLETLGQPHRDDSSNLSPAYMRNRIRHELLPLLARDYNPHVADALLRLGQVSADAQSIVEQAIESFAERCVRIVSATEVQVQCDRLSNSSTAMVRELFRFLWHKQQWPLAEMGLAEWERLTTLALRSDSQTVDFPGPVRAQKKSASLLLTRLDIRRSHA